MQELEFNSDNAQVGFRLDYMELLNWGTFNNRIWQIAPSGNNSLLTGGIGSGKSTVVDALTCLLVPHHKITFNKAAGAESKERTLTSYIRGEYKNTKNEFSDGTEKRKGKPIGLRYNNDSDTSFSVILANFRDLGYLVNTTLVQIFWIENDKVQKLLVISASALRIKETFENIEDGKSLKQRIKNLSNIVYVGDNFSEYSQKFRRLFGMNSEKAIDLFYQTISMKSVSSLTSFVREQMLEQTDVKTQIEDLKKRFNDLNRAYNAVREIRKQRDMLFPLVDLNKNYNDCKQKFEEINNILSAIPSYFASKKIALLEAEIKSCEFKANQLDNQLKQLKSDLESKNKAKNQIEYDLDKNGGSRLKEIDIEIELCEKAKKERNIKYTAYAELLAFCDLPLAKTDRTFYSNIKSAQDRIDFLKNAQRKNAEKSGEIAVNLRYLKETIEKSETELKSLQNRKNQIPLSLLDIRQQLIDDLQIKENEIPFVGELIKVKDEEKKWEGALERLLHGFGISLLVPEKYYKEVSSYINARRLLDKIQRGIKMDYFSVPQNVKYKRQNYEIAHDSVVNKIEIKSNSYFEDWLEEDLKRHFNLRCISLDEFQKIREDAITIEGQYKKGKRHTKDDRSELWDRTKFVLGWSNVEKMNAIKQNLENNLRPKYNAIDIELKKLEEESDNHSNLNGKLNQLIVYQNWNELNWQSEANKIEELKLEKYEIENGSDVLKSLQDNLIKVTNEIVQIKEKETEKTKDIGGIETSIKIYNEEIVAKNTELNAEFDVYHSMIDKLIEQALTIKNTDAICERLRNKYIGKNGEKDKLSEKFEYTRDCIIKTMQSYAKDFPAEAMELSVEIDSLPEFIKKYNDIIKEGLPEHENKFKETLKQTAIEDIRIFDFELDKHSSQIKQKINEINKHLKEIEFNKGTYIRLFIDNILDKEISDFKKALKNCYADILGSSDAYTEDRFDMVKSFLDRFMSNDNKDIEWTKKVTDVRNWFLFSASELYFEDDSEKEHYSDSAGKSGGQKEKLAYTILASALAYQFGLTYGESRSKSFRFVVIDEAFGRGDDESTQFGLELFKKMHLQLLVVTPLQKIHIIENYINTVHIVSNTEGNNSEIQYLTAEEYKLEKQRRNL